MALSKKLRRALPSDPQDGFAAAGIKHSRVFFVTQTLLEQAKEVAMQCAKVPHPVLDLNELAIFFRNHSGQANQNSTTHLP
jgi:hypothetical protein